MARRFTRQHKASAVWSTPPGGERDSGQRFVVTYRDGLGTRRAFGFTDDPAKAQGWLRQIDRHPVFTSGKLVDRSESTAGAIRASWV